jgi:hypothetical protein
MFAALMERGVIDINAVDRIGETALHKAAFIGQADVVAMLLAHGAKVNVALERSGTPLHYAIAQRHEGIAERLIAVTQMDINWRSVRCSPAINLAITENLTGVVRAFLRREDVCLSVSLRRKSLWPPLVVAAYAGNIRMLEILLECPRFALEDESCGRKAACQMATKRGFLEFAQLVMEAMKSRGEGKKKKEKRLCFGLFRRFRWKRNQPKTG